MDQPTRNRMFAGFTYGHVPANTVGAHTDTPNPPPMTPLCLLSNTPISLLSAAPAAGLNPCCMRVSASHVLAWCLRGCIGPAERGDAA